MILIWQDYASDQQDVRNPTLIVSAEHLKPKTQKLAAK